MEQSGLKKDCNANSDVAALLARTQNGDLSSSARDIKISSNLKATQAEGMAPTEQFQSQTITRSWLLRQRVIFYTSTFSIIAPILTTLVPHFVIDAQPFGVLIGSFICIFGSLLNYIFFVRKNRVSAAASVQAIVTLITYSVSVIFSGGIYSQFIVFAPFMPVFGGFLTGIKGAIATTLYLVLFCLLITIFGDSLPPVNQTLIDSEFGSLLQIVGALISVGILTCIYETVTMRSEGELKTANAELHLAKEKLAKSEALLRSVISNVPVMILVKDYTNQGRYSLVNEAAEQFLGAEASELIGRSVQDLLPKHDAEMHMEVDKKVFNSGKASFFDQEEVPFKEGIKTLRTWKVPTYDSAGNHHLMIRLSIDITDEIKLKQDLELERAKSLKNAKLASLGEMSAGIAHEINNPLTIVYGTVRTLPKFANNPEQLAIKIEKIQAASERISKIVRSLRKFSRTSDKSEFKVHSLSNIINEALILTDAKARRHSTKVELENSSENLVLCDEIEIEQVFVNMINNAIDAVKSGEEKWVKLQLKLDAERVVLRIMNSGPRISPEVEKKLFQPFFTTKPVGQGTGLGLSIVKGILDEHHATIDLAIDGRHTCFEIRFPKSEEAIHAT